MNEEMEQRIDFIKREDLAGAPWQITHFDHERQVWSIELCDNREAMTSAVLKIVQELDE